MSDPSEHGNRARFVPRVGALGLAFVVASLAPTRAFAGDAPSSAAAMAKALLEDGARLQKEGRVHEACRKFESSLRIDPAPDTLLRLASCHEEEGKTATAWGEFLDALEDARTANRFDRQKIAKAHIAKLEPLLSRFVLAVPEEAAVPGLVIEIDGASIDKSAWGNAIPIDPGKHTALARAPKYERWEGTLTVEATKTATLVVPKLPRLPDPTPPEAGGRWKKPVGFASLGLSAVLFGVGGYFGAHAISIGRDAAAHCPNLECDADTLASIEEGRTAAMASNVLFGVGLASAAAGVFFLATAPRAGGPAAASRPSTFISIGLGPRAGGLSVGGSF